MTLLMSAPGSPAAGARRGSSAAAPERRLSLRKLRRERCMKVRVTAISSFEASPLSIGNQGGLSRGIQPTFRFGVWRVVTPRVPRQRWVAASKVSSSSLLVPRGGPPSEAVHHCYEFDGLDWLGKM